MLAKWRAEPEVLRWWGPWHLAEPEFVADLADPAIAMWIVEHAHGPFAFAQDYDCHAWDRHPFAHLPAGARGIDQYIGVPAMIGHGHGTAFLRQQCARLFAAGAPAVGTDPRPDNARAIAAYRKVGFATVSEAVDTRWGRAVLMECWADGRAPAWRRSTRGADGGPTAG